MTEIKENTLVPHRNNFYFVTLLELLVLNCRKYQIATFGGMPHWFTNPRYQPPSPSPPRPLEKFCSRPWRYNFVEIAVEKMLVIDGRYVTRVFTCRYPHTSQCVVVNFVVLYKPHALLVLRKRRTPWQEKKWSHKKNPKIHTLWRHITHRSYTHNLNRCEIKV